MVLIKNRNLNDPHNWHWKLISEAISLQGFIALTGAAGVIGLVILFFRAFGVTQF